MIDPAAFVALLRRRGISFVSGVPCSYLGSLLPELWQAPGIESVHAANEGEAVAACAGAALAGRGALAFMQNSGLGNAVSPLSSLTWTFRIPLLLLVTLRGDPRRSDEPQHRLMGPITTDLLDLLQVSWEPLPHRLDDVESSLERAQSQMKARGLPHAWIISPESFDAPAAPAPRALPLQPPLRGAASVDQIELAGPSGVPTRAEALAHIARATPPERAVVLSSTGYTSRELYALEDRANQFYMVGSMGCTSPLGLGLSLARPDVQVAVVEGDGSALMRLSSFAMLGAQGRSNLIHIVLDNAAHESTGGQPTLSPGVRFAEVARAAGYGYAVEGDSLEVLDAVFGQRAAAGPRFAHLRIRPGTRGSLPRPSSTPEEVRERFVRHLDALRGEGLA